CVFRDGEDWVIEDLDSKNGTFLNGKRASRQVLHHGDVLLIGKHTLLFDQHAAGAPATEEKGPSLPALGDTIYLDTSQHRVLAGPRVAGGPRCGERLGNPRACHS